MNRRPGAVAEAFHRATKHSFDSVRRGGHGLDWANKPRAFKRIERAERVPLPADRPAFDAPAFPAVAGRADVAPRPFDLPALSGLLRLAAGVRRRRAYPGGDEFHFRTYASAGALYPVEVYLACADLPGLPAGVYHFDPVEPALVRLRPGDHRGFLARASGGEPAVAHAPVVLVLTGIPWRTTWKYGERGYRHLFWDAGMVVANLLALATAAGWPARAVLGFVDGEVGDLLGLEPPREFPLCLVAVGRDDPTPPAPSGPSPISYEFPPLSAGEVQLPVVGGVHDSGRLHRPEDVPSWRRSPLGPPALPAGEDVRAPSPAKPPDDSIELVIRRRGSARGFSQGPMPAPVLAAVLGGAGRALPLDLATGRLVEIALIANAVDGVEPGAYAFRDGAFTLLRRGEFRREASYLCLEQPLAGQAAATCFLLSDLETVLAALGDRGYRAAQLAAGVVAGRIYLGAYAFGYGATGLTFYDDEVRSFFSTRQECMLVTSVGESRGRRDLRPVR